MVDDELGHDQPRRQEAVAPQDHQRAVHHGRGVDQQRLAGKRARRGTEDAGQSGGGDDLPALHHAQPESEGRQDPHEAGGDHQGVGRAHHGDEGQADDQSEDHPRRGDDGGGEDLARWAVAEQTDTALEPLVQDPTDDPADHVADGRADEQADHGVGTGAVDLAHLVAQQCPEQDDDEADPLDEDHDRSTWPGGSALRNVCVIVTSIRSERSVFPVIVGSRGQTLRNCRGLPCGPGGLGSFS